MAFISDYLCSKCKESFEYLTLKSDDIPECPVCNSTEVEKVFTSALVAVCNDPAVRSEKLKQRSLDDSKKNFKNNWERARAKKPAYFTD